MSPETQPTDQLKPQLAPHLTLAPMVGAQDQSTYVHKDLVRVVEPWAIEAHIGPVKAEEKFGDVESWAAYVTRFAFPSGSHLLLTWTQDRLRAVLDYHDAAGTADRCQWTASHPFQRTRQWIFWEGLTNGKVRSQRELIEALEDRRDDVKTPDAAELVGMLQTLRGTVNASAEATLNPDGSTSLEYKRATTVSVSLPPTITIGIPVLRGHMAEDEQGLLGPVTYEIDVRLRVNVDDNGKLEFRLNMPNAEQALEDAVADRVAAAKALLGENLTLLRAAS